MIMMCETKSEDMKNLTAIQEALTNQGKELGVEIRAQHADIFLSMHRVGQEALMLSIDNILETNQMIHDNKLDVRTITMGISLLECIQFW